MIDKIFERLFVAILALAILPCIVSIVVHALGPILLTVGIVAVIAGVYRSLDRARPGTKARNSAGGERTPILPRGDR